MTSQPLPDGLYTIGKDPKFLATLQSDKPGTDVVIRPANETEAVGQRWSVQRTPKGTYTIINRGNSLSFEGQPEHGKPIEGIPSRPHREWSLVESTERHAYYIVVPGGPFDGRELTVDLSPSQITPPHTWLGYLNVENRSQAWVFSLILL
ncbi:hypothetical protein BJV77DRAFT_1151700 [Russula vinacea]|nr:hypothetical protein BJV77DRAFT_1151700 [Russula vinacea]